MMNKKQLIIAWVTGLIICLIILNVPTYYLIPTRWGNYIKVNNSVEHAIPRTDWDSIAKDALLVLIIGGLLFYSLRNRTRRHINHSVVTTPSSGKKSTEFGKKVLAFILDVILYLIFHIIFAISFAWLIIYSVRWSIIFFLYWDLIPYRIGNTLGRKILKVEDVYRGFFLYQFKKYLADRKKMKLFRETNILKVEVKDNRWICPSCNEPNAEIYDTCTYCSQKINKIAEDANE